MLIEQDALGRPRMNLLSRKTCEAATRMYRSTAQAAGALGVTQWGFLRACYRHGIEPPFVIRRNRGAA